MSPQALRERVVPAEDRIAGDAETDQTLRLTDILPAPAAAGPSGDQSDSLDSLDSDSPPTRPSHRKRKRVRHLFSSSDEDDEDLRNIKRRVKQRKDDVGKKRNLSAVKCRVKSLHPPPLSVAARVDEEDKVVSWLSVSTEQYKQVCR